ncbi:MAG TPA: hypothetical protein VMX17_08165 [Candidatus Glassbacteria bacterium]|nr:hypothetical protein [Candidatus Glassbacteria bacterium]
MSKLLIIFRLHDLTYGDGGNALTLAVRMREDNTLGYALYTGWQDSGMGNSIGNIQLRESLPLSPSAFKNTKALQEKIASILKTGCGSNKIKTFEILNEIGKSATAKKGTKTKEQKEAAKAFKNLIQAYDVADDLQNDGDDDNANKLRDILRKVDGFISKQM